MQALARLGLLQYHEEKPFVGFLEGSMLALFFKAGGPHTPVHKVDLSCERSG